MMYITVVAKDEAAEVARMKGLTDTLRDDCRRIRLVQQMANEQEVSRSFSVKPVFTGMLELRILIDKVHLDKVLSVVMREYPTVELSVVDTQKP